MADKPRRRSAPTAPAPSGSAARPPAPRALPGLRLPVNTQRDNPPLPNGLQIGAQRGDASLAEALVPGLVVSQRWELATVARGEAPPAEHTLAADQQLLALEAADGGLVFMRADALAAQLQRARPELIGADGAIDFAAFRLASGGVAGASRGVGDVVWRAISALVLPDDSIAQEARSLVGDTLLGKLSEPALAWSSWQGAQALMKAIENGLAGEPGLYRWGGAALSASDRCPEPAAWPQDPRLAPVAAGQSALVFIHGTGSHTLGGFGELAGSASWPLLQRQFGDRIFGFEHRTFSESPIANAMALVEALPAGARLCLVTHSRGGLVGDLLCLATDASADGAGFDALVDDYRRQPRPDEVDAEAADPALATLRLAVAANEQAMLRALGARLRDKRLTVQRYVRVAAPARGTALLSDNLDVFLSGLLSLVRQFGAWSVGAVVGVLATPVAGQAARAAADRGLKFLARVVMEIADKRLQPQVVPGIEVMLPEAPMGMLLARAQRRAEVQLAVVAGDIEGGALLQRLGLMFTDWMLFDQAANDLVVPTDSMFGGLAGQQSASTRAIFVQGANVNHFRYFRDDTCSAGVPLPRALQQWLSEADPLPLAPWLSLQAAQEAAPPPTPSRGDPASRPRLVFVPGIMGSMIEADGQTIWLNPLNLALGRLSRIAFDASGPFDAPDLVGLAYGTLASHLNASHEVVRHAYDWRQPIGQLGRQLAQRLAALLQADAQRPLNLLVHSMGGLVLRAAFADQDHPTLWDDIVASGGRLVMMGTPNHGSHLFVETLLGRSGTIRMLARADLRNNMQQVLDIVAGFPGAVHLLPAPGFTDATGRAGEDYYQAAQWQAMKSVNNDFWFGHQLAGAPSQAQLDQAAAFWAVVADTSWVQRHPEQVAYIYGKADNTPCGLQWQLDAKRQRSGLTMLGTAQGDGSVSWASGRLPGLPDSRSWLMPVDHMGLTSTPRYFNEIEALLLRGRPLGLGGLPATRGDEAPAINTRQVSPPPGFPNDEAMVRQLLGGGAAPLPVARATRQSLALRVRAMDVRFARVPVLCGHYRNDTIAGAEALIDRHLVGGALRRRAQLGIHAGDAGTASVVLMPRRAAERRQGLGRGAVVVGLGEMGPLAGDALSEIVRAGVLRFLMHASDRLAEERQHDDPMAGDAAQQTDERAALRLASLLLGTNSAAQLSVDDAVKAVVLGVLRANAQFADQADGGGPRGQQPVYIGDLELLEVYRDAAISAAEVVAALPDSLADDLRQLDAQISADQELHDDLGARDRLGMAAGRDYWPRLDIGDADRDDSACSDDCYAVQVRTAIPPDALRQILSLYGSGDVAAAARQGLPLPTGLALPPLVRHAQRLRYVFLGERANAPVLMQQRQPGLVEGLIEQAVNGPYSTRYEPGDGFGNTLYQLLLPVALKGLVRKASNLMLVVDEATANLPWELLEIDGQPLVLGTRVVRQLKSARFRRDPGSADKRTACVIANPSTLGFHAQFGGPGWQPARGAAGKPAPDRLVSLAGAEQEGEAVANALEHAGYDVAVTLPDARAGDVFRTLFSRPHQVLAIAAHGVHGLRAADGSYRTGVVLSDGLLLSAAEVALMERVPDLVFLSCCQLGKVGSGAGASQRLAYSLARELIEMGVRCVVAAGWAVDDAAAQTFSQTFFSAMTAQGLSFADAVFAARQRCHALHPRCNTWGAYQAYGDPQFCLSAGQAEAPDNKPLRAPQELLQWLEGRRLDAHGQFADSDDDAATSALAAELARVELRLHSLPAAWATRADVLYALGRLYAEFGAPGFEAAQAPLLQAIAGGAADQGAGGDRLAPLAAIELLANCEARSVASLLERGDPPALTLARQRADRALLRLQCLLQLSSNDPLAPDAAGMAGNAERLALLGSACKRKAEVLLHGSEPGAASGQALHQLLTQARDAYRAGERASAAPYQLFNRLQLDALLGAPGDGAAGLISAAQRAAAERLPTSLSFWDALALGDGELTRWLFDAQALGADPLSALVSAYSEPLRQVMATARQRESVTRQLQLLARFMRALAQASAADISMQSARAELLETLAQRLRPASAVQR